MRLEGLTGLYKGILPLALAESPVLALAFSGKEFGSRILNRATEYNDNSKSFLAGCLGGAISTIVSCPAELLKIKSQSNTKFQTNYSTLVKEITKADGVRGLYKGYFLTLIRDVPAFAMYFGIFEIGCNKLLKDTDKLYKILIYQLMLGSISGIASWVITYPVDVIKTIIQDSEKNSSVKKIFIRNFKNFGWRFFFQGLVATSLSAIPNDAFCLMIYTQLHQRL